MIEVKDRVPTKPNRIKLTNASTGAIEYYIWERADEPTEAGTPINKALFDSIGDDLDNLKSIPNGNLLANGDFQVWQRGTYFDGHKGGYTADRWNTVGNQVWKSGNGFFGCSEVADGNNVGNMGISQYVEIDKTKLLGKKVTLSVACYSSTNLTAQLCIGYNQVNIKHISLTSALTEYSMTATVTEEMFAPNGALYIQAPMKMTSSVTGAILYVAWVKLELGDSATPFISKPYAEELNVCKYYYHKPSNPICLAPCVASKAGDTNSLRFYHCYPNTMRIAPTVTILTNSLQHGSTGEATITSSGVSSIGLDGCEFRVNANGSLEYSPRLWVRYELDAEIY